MAVAVLVLGFCLFCLFWVFVCFGWVGGEGGRGSACCVAVFQTHATEQHTAGNAAIKKTATPTQTKHTQQQNIPREEVEVPGQKVHRLAPPLVVVAKVLAHIRDEQAWWLFVCFLLLVFWVCVRVSGVLVHVVRRAGRLDKQRRRRRPPNQRAPPPHQTTTTHRYSPTRWRASRQSSRPARTSSNSHGLTSAPRPTIMAVSAPRPAAQRSAAS